MSFRRLFRQLAAGLACYCLLSQLLPAWAAAAPDQVTAINPPATPLVLCDPYFSIWSPAAKLADADTTHWTGKPNRLTSLVSIDGKAYRLIGREPAQVSPLEQTSTRIRPTQTASSSPAAAS
jgi:hypothetical protein